jgi:hypothetical protein
MSLFCGVWILDSKNTPSQNKILNALQRPEWQIRLCNDVSESITCFVQRKSRYDVIVKDVSIKINSNFLKTLTFMSFGMIPFSQLEYTQSLVLNSTIQSHVNDAKQFGRCKSSSKWIKYNEEFQDVWYLKDVVLKVRHKLRNQNTMIVHLCVKNKNSGKITRGHKTYNLKRRLNIMDINRCKRLM